MVYQLLLRRARTNRLAALSVRPQVRDRNDTITNVFADID